MNRIKTLVSILILTITFSSCGNKKNEEKNNSKTESETVELPEKVLPNPKLPNTQFLRL